MGVKEQIISAVRKDGSIVLTEIESKQIIGEEEIRVVETKLAVNQKAAMTIAREMGFPVALKVVSREITHKSDGGGVRLNLQNVSEVGRAYSEMVAIFKKSGSKGEFLGVGVQKMVSSGIEAIIGMSKDSHFGPVLMFGLGGVFVEVLEDVSFRIVPIVNRDAKQMIREIKGYPVFKGYRGRQGVDESALEDTLLKLSDFVNRTPEIKELDLNPVFASADGVVVADARIILEPLDN